MNGLEVKTRGNGVSLAVRVKPRASKSRVVGVREGALEVAVAAPPVDGEANAELVRFLAKLLDLPRSAVRLISGETARLKVIECAGLDEAGLRRSLSESV
jgi:uncharacterized protein